MSSLFTIILPLFLVIFMQRWAAKSFKVEMTAESLAFLVVTSSGSTRVQVSLLVGALDEVTHVVNIRK